MDTSSAVSLADSLNLGCMCKTLNPDRLREQLEAAPSLTGMVQGLATSHPHLFSETAVFLDARMRDALADTVAAIERVIALPQYQNHVLTQAADIARHAVAAHGVFMGFDFHMGADGPRLIEINTNAGGAFLNAALARAHRACCGSMQALVDSSSNLLGLDQVLRDMFVAEWQAQRGATPLRTILIVDDAPETQYLAPEFALARQLFMNHGITAVVADARALIFHDGRLWHPKLGADQSVDLIYNRLTDFDFSGPDHAALHDAYLHDAVVLTPHPRAHALYADKRNLITLGDPSLLASWRVSERDIRLLQAAIPHTELVTPERAEDLWSRRRRLFFKPVAGYGGKAAYRGDKLTRGVWSEIIRGGFIAQELVLPSERLVEVDGQPKRLKLDIRAYTYQGQIQLLAARTWTGQTTNFRTAGGGFSPVVVLPAADLSNASETPASCDP